VENKCGEEIAMQRRSFLKKATIGAGVAAIGTPAIAQYSFNKKL
jgi:hypothetical protein